MVSYFPAPTAPIAIVGGGSIGMAFAIVFARTKRPIRLFEPDADRRARLQLDIAARLADLARYDLLAEPADLIAGRISYPDSLAAAVLDACYVQECVPERLELKASLFAQLDRLAPAAAILASASSAIPSSRFAADLAGRARVLVVHPGNPPFLISIAEVVPAPFTSAAAVDAACAILSSADMTPIRVGHEVEGFVYNRLQGALLREAYCLVRDGVASVADIDTIVRDGLGLRWSVIGPFETVDLNTQGGIASHAEKMGPAYERMGAERGQHDPWTPELVEQVSQARRDALPLADWAARVAWRDRQMMALVRHRRHGGAA